MNATVNLIDGTEVSTSSDAWRVECFQRWERAKQIMSMRNIEDRRACIERVRRTQGDLAADRLQRVIQQMWSKK